MSDLDAIDTEAVYESLVALGKTPIEVAESLKAMGIRGEPGCGSRCPIANFVARTTGLENRRVSVIPENVVLFDDPKFVRVVINCPAPVYGFITEFDLETITLEDED